MNGRIQRLIKSLTTGVKVTTSFGITKIPNPTASMILFHKNQKNDNYVTLQAQTTMVKSKLTQDQLDLVVQKIANISKIKYEKCVRFLSGCFQQITLFLGILLLVSPLVAQVYYGIAGFWLGLLGYISILTFFNSLKSVSKYYLTMRLRENFRIAELFINQVNWEYRDKNIIFRIGKNLYWVELHITNSLTQNIEIGFSSGFSSAKTVELFNPFKFEQQVKIHTIMSSRSKEVEMIPVEGKNDALFNRSRQNYKGLDNRITRKVGSAKKKKIKKKKETKKFKKIEEKVGELEVVEDELFDESLEVESYEDYEFD